MVYINLRLNVADFDKWLAAFHGFESYRKELGSTEVNQIFHDVDDPNNVTLIMEWDEATNAKAFLNNPQTKSNMDSAGFESYRRELGSTGTNQIFHDVDDPNNVTLIMEWDEATNAKAFLNNPQTKSNMDSAGVTGRPTVLAVQVKA